MATDKSENMVLRTVYLPQELDARLRKLAFSRSESKAELMRTFIVQGLDQLKANGEVALADDTRKVKVTPRSAITRADPSPTVKTARKAPHQAEGKKSAQRQPELV